MVINLYLRNGIVYIPTLNLVNGGPYIEFEPVGVAPVGDSDALRMILREAFRRGNPIIPSYSFENNPAPVILKYAKLKSYSKFEREAVAWIIDQKDDQYRIIYQKWRKDRGWEDDEDTIISIPTSTGPDGVIDRMIAVLQASGAQ